MPLYEFFCADCGPFPVFRRMDQRDLPEPCPQCETAVRRSVTAPHLALMPAARRQAHAINERSRHEPKVRNTHRCSSSCGCGPAASRPKTAQPARPRKNNRPWMLGH